MRRSLATGALLLLAVLFFWAGMVVSISFLETPLKFTAPRITLPLGLSIGRVVFAALNRAELLLNVAALLCGFYLRLPARLWAGLGVLTSILLLQTFWLLPALDERTLEILSGLTPPTSSLHVFYIVLDVVKLLVLVVTGGWVFHWALQAASSHPARPFPSEQD